MRCESCGFANPEGVKFCNECGVAFKRRCTQCGSENAPQAKFCGECGRDLRAPALATVSPQGEQPTEQASVGLPSATPRASEAERRQLTVMFCDLVGSTTLSAQLDPEDYRTVVQQYQQTGATVIAQYDGHIAQYLGDGLLVYFGYPVAHEDDAQRAMRTALGVVEAVQQLSLPTIQLPRPLQVRIGIHSGLVVIGDVGVGERTEQLALGETPNIAARLQGVAEPNTVIISAATQRLVERQFECQPFGSHVLKGVDTPIAVYHMRSERQGVSPLVGRTTLTPLVGREQEVGLLVDRWEQAKEGRGQVVLLSGEPGIGKSRLTYTLREHVTNEGSLLFEARCSPYYQHSALYPLIDVLQRTLLLTRQDTSEEQIAKLERTLALFGMQETVPLFTALLSLPTTPQYPPLNLTPQKQKERTLQALVQMMLAQAERQATVSVWEDLHWADPSSLEFLTLLIEQLPMANLLLVLTFRPEFTPPWKLRSHISQLVLNRLGKRQVEVMIEKVAESKNLSAEVIEQIRMKTDGVPLFIEELTKSVIESATGGGAQYTVPLQTIPATLQEALLARLDRLSTARQVAQLGATLSREFSYELLQAVSPLSKPELQAALSKLVEAEILYQRGIGEQSRYFFKHALIQDTAYQSLLKSTRQQYHRQIARVLEERFPDTKEIQPELLAHHYTEAGLTVQAIPYWQRAGQRAVERSANTEAIAHLTLGIALLKTLPDTLDRVQQELTLQIALGSPLMAVKGYAAPELEATYARAHTLCQQVGETSQLFAPLRGLCLFYLIRGKLQTARKLGEQLLDLAHRLQDFELLVEAHYALGDALQCLGEFIPAHEIFEQGIGFYDPYKHRSLAFRYGQDPGVVCRSHSAFVLWYLGYPDQGLKRAHEALTLARELSHSFSVTFALGFVATLHQLRQEEQLARECAETTIALSTEQGFPFFEAWGAGLKGWVLAKQGQEKEGVAQISDSLVTLQAIGAEIIREWFLVLLAEAYRQAGQVSEGLRELATALAMMQEGGGHFYEAELYRLKGELTLQSKVQGPKSQVEKEAEACFLKAIEVARKQQAKSLELRTVMSLVRLRQQQTQNHESRNTQHEARTRLNEEHRMLSEIYNWFTEGFDTKDLQEAKTLLDALS